MLKLYDYIYYRTYRTYKYKWKDNDPGMYAHGLVSILHLLNISTLYFFIDVLFNLSYHISEIAWAIFMFTIALINFLRYRYFKPINQLESKWGNKSDRKSQIKGLFVLLYILFSFAIFILEIKYQHLIVGLGNYLGLN